MIRQPAVAGHFYPGDARELAQAVDESLSAREKKTRARGCIVPHAGYVYSGRVAGAIYGALDLPSRYILLGPRHWPQGRRLAILSEGAWLTPLGEAKLDTPLAKELKKACPALEEDAAAHAREHSLEVQLPFLQRMVPEFRFVPIVIGPARFEELAELGLAVARIVASSEERVMVVASSDMNHRENDAITRAKDRTAIEAILALDARRLDTTVHENKISMCGYAPAVALLVAARELGSTRAELVRYATSTDVNGDREDVVGYAGIIVH